MARGHAAGRVVRSKRVQPERCLALSGKGVPTGDELTAAIQVVGRAAEALRDPGLRGAHPFKAAPAEVRLRVPEPGARGGTGWTVFVRVPSWVGQSEATAAVAEVSAHSPLAKSIRLSPVVTAPAPAGSRPGRDHQPGQIRMRRTGPQHRARELR